MNQTVKRLVVTLTVVCSFFIWLPIVASAANPGLYFITHAVASSFTRNGENYYPNGNLLFTVSRRANSTIQTLDEFVVAPVVEGKFLRMGMHYLNDSSIGAYRELIKIPSAKQIPYWHIRSTWPIANKPLGKYAFMFLIDEEIIASYLLEIVE